MKTKINGFEIECTPKELKELLSLNKTERKQRKLINAINKYKRWSENENKTIKTLFAHGYNDKQIAQKIGRSKLAVTNQRSILGAVKWHKG